MERTKLLYFRIIKRSILPKAVNFLISFLCKIVGNCLLQIRYCFRSIEE